jgi:hypothetical protein
MSAALILQLILQYGPALESTIGNLIAKLESGATLSVADVEAQFAGLTPYSGYNIRLASIPPIVAPAATSAPVAPPATTDAASTQS